MLKIDALIVIHKKSYEIDPVRLIYHSVSAPQKHPADLGSLDTVSFDLSFDNHVSKTMDSGIFRHFSLLMNLDLHIKMPNGFL